jgi:hypothetical protein
MKPVGAVFAETLQCQASTYDGRSIKSQVRAERFCRRRITQPCVLTYGDFEDNVCHPAERVLAALERPCGRFVLLR